MSEAGRKSGPKRKRPHSQVAADDDEIQVIEHEHDDVTITGIAALDSVLDSSHWSYHVRLLAGEITRLGGPAALSAAQSQAQQEMTKLCKQQRRTGLTLDEGWDATASQWIPTFVHVYQHEVYRLARKHARAVVAGANASPSAPAGASSSSTSAGSGAAALPGPPASSSSSFVQQHPLLVVCILISGSFPNAQVWLDWLTAAKHSGVADRLRFVVHASNISGAEYAAVQAFVRDVQGQLVPTIPTVYASMATARAEAAMYDLALKCYGPDAHWLLVSEKSVPLLAPAQACELLERLHRRESITEFVDQTTGTKELHSSISASSPDLRMYIASQFKCVYGGHWSTDVRAPVAQLMDAFEDWPQENGFESWYDYGQRANGASPDEWLIPSVLATAFPAAVAVAGPTRAMYAAWDEAKHAGRAVPLTETFVKNKLPTQARENIKRVEGLLEDGRDPRTHVYLALRKVVDVPGSQLRRVLAQAEITMMDMTGSQGAGAGSSVGPGSASGAAAR